MTKRLLPILALAPLLVVAVTSSLSSERPSAPGTLLEFSSEVEQLASRVLEGTVHIEVVRGQQGGSGSGFVIDALRGWVVTNRHVVEELDARVRVTLHDGRVVPGDVVAVDEKTDLAAVRIPEGAAHRQIAWGDSDALRPGSLVLAVGNPLGLIGTTSLGVISGLNRIIGLEARGAYEDFLQFDAFIDHGSSGGPLVDMRGQVVGVNTAIGGEFGPGTLSKWQGISYAVPAALARRVVSDLFRYQRVRRGYFGVSSVDLEPGDEKNFGLERPVGAKVLAVTKDSPAERAGMQRGDVILAVDGREVTGVQQLRARISAVAPGDWVELRVWREKKEIRVRVQVAELKQ